MFVLLNRFVTLVGGTKLRLPSRLELMEESLMSEATLAESESRSSLDSALLEEREVGLRFNPPTAWNGNKERLIRWCQTNIIYLNVATFTVKWDLEQPVVNHQMLPKGVIDDQRQREKKKGYSVTQISTLTSILHPRATYCLFIELFVTSNVSLCHFPPLHIVWLGWTPGTQVLVGLMEFSLKSALFSQGKYLWHPGMFSMHIPVIWSECENLYFYQKIVIHPHEVILCFKPNNHICQPKCKTWFGKSQEIAQFPAKLEAVGFFVFPD